MRERWLLLLAFFLLMTPPGRAQTSSPAKSRRFPGRSPWVQQTLKKMTLREKLGQLLVPYFFGRFTSTESAEYKELLRQVEELHVGGFILGTRPGPLGIERSEVYPTAALMNQLQRRAKVPLLVGADFETGTAMRLEEGTYFPHAMAIAATGDPRNAYIAGKVTALEARAAGIQWIFGPVADVNSNPANPIINIRSFGENPERVAEFVGAYIRGVEDDGALSTAKHFPGQGNTSSDSHLALVTVPSDRAQLESVELVPFRAAIAAGVSAVMPGHLAVAAFEPDPTIPATLSPRIMTGVLRDKLKFKGLTVTDALDMGGVSESPGEVAVLAMVAGADVLLQVPNPEAALAALEDAVASGRLSVARIEASVSRILQAKARLGLDKNRLADLDRLNASFGRPEFAAQAQDIADHGVTLLRDKQRLLPLDATKPARILLVELSADPDPIPGAAFENDIRWRADSLNVLRADARFVKPENLKLPPAESYDVAIAAILVRVADRKGNVGLPEDEAALVDQLLSAGKPVVVASFGSPYLIQRFPAAPAWLASFSTTEVAQRAAGRALFGQVSIGGTIPVSVPGAVKLGEGLRVAANPMTLQPTPTEMATKLKPAFEILDRAVTDHAFPGGVLAVGLGNTLLVHPFGKLSYDGKAPAVSAATIYDVASLTKPVVTATAILMLAAAGHLDLDAPIARYLPEWAFGPNTEWRKRVTVRHLLLHTSGLPAHRNYYEETKGEKAIVARILAEPLVTEPGLRVEYSDLGFILLGEIIERLTGATLDAFARQRIFEPLGMDDSRFNPPRSLRPRIAPTENDVAFRKRQLQGEVDDSNAFAMGGVAGNAGLFSTAGDLAAFGQMLLNGGIYAHRRLLTRAQIDQIAARQTIAGSARALGWDVPTVHSSTGKYFSARSFGHNGYTGTSLWIDPEKNLFVILLTNRVHPSAENDKIRQARPALHDAIIESLGLANQRLASR